MRPTPEGVGNIPRASALFGASAASMRPTPEGVGNRRREGRCAGNEDASMRPTPEGVGNCATASSPTNAHRSFNEAHARRRGKFDPHPRYTGPTLASMRPTPEGVGNGGQVRHLVRGVAASMRPTPEGVGNGARASTSGPCGATLQ